jgi:uncharacterized protein (TIGR03382 family)
LPFIEFGIELAKARSQVSHPLGGEIMGILLFIVFGFVVGLIARALMPGRQSMGLLMTTGLGIVGSFIGGLIGSMISNRPLGDFNTAGIIGSVIGAMLLLLAVGALSGRRRMTV